MQRSTKTKRVQDPSPALISIETTLIEGTVNQFKPFMIKMVSQTPLEIQWNHLMKNYHYLGYSVLVGTCLKYLVFSNELVVAAT
jgi:hypothetical protein